jgi:hypothetical protein
LGGGAIASRAVIGVPAASAVFFARSVVGLRFASVVTDIDVPPKGLAREDCYLINTWASPIVITTVRV